MHLLDTVRSWLCFHRSDCTDFGFSGRRSWTWTDTVWVDGNHSPEELHMVRQPIPHCRKLGRKHIELWHELCSVDTELFTAVPVVCYVPSRILRSEESCCSCPPAPKWGGRTARWDRHGLWSHKMLHFYYKVHEHAIVTFKQLQVWDKQCAVTVPAVLLVKDQSGTGWVIYSSI